MTKVFTGLLLADMVQRGEVALADPASKFLPAGVRMPERGRPITLLDLATHTSGLPSMPTNFVLTARPNPIEAYTVDQLYAFLSTHALAHEPGTRWQYSNLGVALLGRLLGRRGGLEYEELLTRRVLAPLGLRDTAIHLNTAQRSRLAPGHDRYLLPVHSDEMIALPASGSLRSTANDLLKLLAAYLEYDDTPLREAMHLQLVPGVPVNDRQALGWAFRLHGDDRVFHHDGGKAGYRAGIAFYPRARTGIVILTNTRGDDRPIYLALHLLMGRNLDPPPPAPAPKKVARLSRRELERLTGRYQLPSAGTLVVVRSGDRLLVDYDGSGNGLLFTPESPTDFFYSPGNDEITFQLHRDGRVTGLELHDDGRGKSAPRHATRLAD